MSGITRYIFRQLAVGTVLVSIALAVIVWLTQSLQFLQFIVNKGLSIAAWLKLTLLLLPSFLLTILPAALFFVTLFIYNKLTTDRELVVVQAAGVSRMRLAVPAMIAAAAVTTVGYALSLFVVPGSVKAFKEVQWVLRKDVSQLLLREGTFNQLAKGLTVYVRGRGRTGELLGVLVHDMRRKDRTETLMAERGVISSGGAGPRIELTNGNRQELVRGTAKLSVLYFDTHTFELGGIEANTPDRYEDNRERSTYALLTASAGEGTSERSATRMRAEGHQRLVGPFTAFGYALVALAFLLTGAFDRRGQTARLMAAIGTGIVFQAAALGAANLAGTDSVFIPLMYAVALLPVAAGLYMIVTPDRRLRRRRIDMEAAGTA
jgi:lipopolysaccharide export system permease protein